MNKTPLFALAAFAVAGLLFVYSNQGTQVETDIDLTNVVETTADMGTTALTVGEDILLEDIAPAAGDEEGIAADEDMGEEEAMPEEDMDMDTDADAEDDAEGDMTEGDEGSDAEDMPMEDEEGESVH
ncbi:MAG: hypothetical protein HND56_04975 [Pseudomonadota bacterium]|jgi:hypothetical protein|nr:hypothetical protein [Pseudomonadota bacterium]QKK05080.1 MAG: hypothetical protein HND56_04975 [Pseudomonadota bacterium]